MSCFFYVADDGSKPAFPSLKTIAQYGKHEVMGMLKVPFYERKGDASGTDGYLGYPYKHGLLSSGKEPGQMEEYHPGQIQTERRIGTDTQ